MGEGVFARALSAVGNTAREIGSAIARGARRLAGARTTPEGLTWTSKSTVEFEGMEVRAVRSLDHLSEREIRYIMKNEWSPRAAGRSDRIILHHLGQKAEGPLVEMPARFHNPGNRIQHPFGNMGGLGNGPERQAYNQWRTRYWHARYVDELRRRGLE
jgi:hypothetical protein